MLKNFMDGKNLHTYFNACQKKNMQKKVSISEQEVFVINVA